MGKNEKPRVLIVMDFIPPEDWFLQNHLRCVGYPVDTIGTTYNLLHASRGYLSLIRWVGWVSLAYRSFHRRREFDVMVFWNSIVGLLSCCFFRIARSNRQKIIMLNLIYHRKNWFHDTLRTWLYRFAFRRVNYLAVGSEAIGQYYEKLFGFPKFKTGLFPECVGKDQFEEGRAKNLDNYIFAGGAANRDWATFFNAMRIVNAPAIAVSWKHSFNGLKVPENVRLRYDLPFEMFHDILRKSRIVVITLRDPLMISGMEVLDKSMALGKAIIVTKTSVTSTHLEEGITGLFVEPGNAEHLASRIKYLLENPEVAKRLGMQAQQRARAVFTPEDGAEKIRQMIDSVYSEVDSK
jgi:glycosyltransferase involved in cell wall biosynthesis